MSENNGNNGHQQVSEWLPELLKIHGKKALGIPHALSSLVAIFQTDRLGEWQDVEEILHQNKIEIGPLKEVIKGEIRKALEEERKAAQDAKRARKQADKLLTMKGSADGTRYEFKNGQILFDGEPIANFVAQITGDISFDDQLEPRREYEISGQVAGSRQMSIGRIPCESYTKSSEWIEKILGACAHVAPGRSEHVRQAIKIASDKCVTRKIIAHTGWRDDGEGWRYYHAGGAIGAQGLIKADVELDGGLDLYSIPAPANDREIADCWYHFEQLLECHQPHVVAPLLGAVFCPIVDKPNFSTFSIGETGFGKTTYNLLFLSMLSGELVRQNKPPADWEGTLFGHQVRAFKAQSLPLLIDEYVPEPGPAGEKKRHVCTEMLRSQGNQSGRTAGNVHGGLRKERYPRGLVMATGEDVPASRSLRARCVIVEFDQRMTPESKALLSTLQTLASKDVFAKLGSRFIQWLATNGTIQQKLDSRQDVIHKHRVQWMADLSDAKVHERTPSNMAALERAWGIWFEFASAICNVSDEKIETWRAYIRKGLDGCARKQAPWLTDAETHTKFMHLVTVALSSGSAHLVPAGKDGFTAGEMESYGWRAKESSTRLDTGEMGSVMRWDPQGAQIGWADEKYIYLLPDVARKVADALLPPHRGLGAISRIQFDKLLRNAGVVVPESAQNSRKTATIRKQIAKTSHEVYRFKIETILAPVFTDE